MLPRGRATLSVRLAWPSMIAALERIGTRMWTFHFRLPAWLWWLMGLALVALALIAPKLEVSMAIVVLAFIALAGGVRWRAAKRRCRHSLLVALFYEGANAKGRAEEAQRIVVDTLRSHLPTELRDLVQPLALEIGSDEQTLAEQTRKRLRGMFVLHGRIASHPEGSWSIYPRLLEPAFDSTTHIDWFTRDRTPANPRFGPFVSSLTPQIGVHDEEFPLEFCRDLEALLRGILGRAAVAFEAYEEAMKPLEEALKIAGESTNAQIDALRLALARAMAAEGEIDEAINYLRSRAEGENPSPELLRSFAHLLLDRANRVATVGIEPDLADRDEQIALLRLAREHIADPLRDQSTYNLFAALDFGGADEEERREASELLEELLRSRTRYGKQWYVRRAAALRSWRRVEKAWAAEDQEAAQAAGKDAAKWYSRTIRARPRLQLKRVGRPPWRWLHWIPLSPILYANGVDAHRVAGNRIRARWLEWRFQRIRKRFWKRAWKATKAQNWARAMAFYDWVAIVGRRDEREMLATTYAAICRWKYEQRDEAEHDWAVALAQYGPIALLARANLIWFFKRWGIDATVPGDEPTSLEEVTALVNAMLEEAPGTEGRRP